jgi:hypothetical protein
MTAMEAETRMLILRDNIDRPDSQQYGVLAWASMTRVKVAVLLLCSLCESIYRKR